MKRLAGEGIGGCGARCGLGHAATAAIIRVADQGVPNMGHVDSYLVRTAGFQMAANQGRVITECFNYPNVGYSLPPAMPEHGLFLAFGPVASDSGIKPNGATGFEADARDPPQPWISGIRSAVAKRQVTAFDGVGGKLGCQAMMGSVGLGDDKEPGRILVDSMDNSGAPLSADAGEVVPEVMQERVDQRARRCPGGRVDHHSCGLVDDCDVGVFKSNRKGNFFGPHMRVSGVRDRDLVDFSVSDAALGVVDHGSVAADGTLGHKSC